MIILITIIFQRLRNFFEQNHKISNYIIAITKLLEIKTIIINLIKNHHIQLSKNLNCDTQACCDFNIILTLLK